MLGFQISQDLDWKDHIEKLIEKLNTRTALISRLVKTGWPAGTLSIVGEALCNSLIRYGSAVYATVRISEICPTNGMMKQLQLMQNNMMRTILKLKRHDQISVQTLLQETGYMSVNQMATYHTLLECYGIVVQDSIPEIRKKLMIQRSTGRETRESKKFLLRVQQPRRKRHIGFQHKASRVWNILPEEIKHCDKKAVFARRIRDWIIKNIPI